MNRPRTSLAALREALAANVPAGRGDEDGVRRQWWAALATLQEDFLLPLRPLRGVWLAAPLPALYEPELLRDLRGWVWAPANLEPLQGLPSARLLPGTAGSDAEARALTGFERLPLEPADGSDPLLLLITPSLQVALCLDGPPRGRRLVVRFDPPGLSAALTLLDERLQRQRPEAARALRSCLQELGPLHNDGEVALHFWPRLAERLAAIAPASRSSPWCMAAAAARPRRR